jgi:hypothetical protein
LIFSEFEPKRLSEMRTEKVIPRILSAEPDQIKFIAFLAEKQF